MSTRKKVEMLKDISGDKELVYPLVDAEHVLMSDGRSLEEAISQDLSQAVVEHSKSTFKPGAGDNIDVSNSIIDGEPGEIKIEGQTYQNLLDWPEGPQLTHSKSEFEITDGQPVIEGYPVNLSENDSFKELKIKGQTIKNMTSEPSSHEFSVENEDIISAIYDKDEKIDYVDEYDSLVIKGKSVVNMLAETCGTPAKTVENEKDIIPDINSTLDITTTDGLYHEAILYGKTLKNELVPYGTEIEEIHASKVYSDDLGIKVSDNVNFDMAVVKGKTLVNAVKESTLDTDYISLDREYQGESIKIDGTEEGNLQNVILEGQTLVNAIQGSSEHDMAILDLDSDISVQSTTLTDTVQGGIHGAKLEGMTLVNLAKTKMVDLENGRIQIIELSMNLKAERSYTLIVNKSNNDDEIGVTVYGKTVDDSPQILLTTLRNNGISKILISGESITTEVNKLRFQVNQTDYDNGKRGLFDNIVILEGDYTNIDIPYFEGMKSVQMPNVITTGKNLFNIDDPNNLGNSSSYTRNGLSLTCNYISQVVFGYTKLDKNKTYTISFDYTVNSEGAGESLAYAFCDKNQLYSQTESYNIELRGNYIVGQTVRRTYTLSNKEIIWVQGGADTTFSNIQIEEGSTATSCESYKSSILTTQPLKDGLVCWLDGKDGIKNSNTWIDKTGNGNNATLVNFSHNDSNGWTGNSLKFDGVDAYCELTPFVTDSFTINMEVNIKQGYTNNNVVLPEIDALHWYSKGGLFDADAGSVKNDFGLSVNEEGIIYAGVGNLNSADQSITSSNSYLNEYTYISFVRDKEQGIFKLYVNGILHSQGNCNTNSLNDPEKFIIGDISTNLESKPIFDCYSVTVYNKALTTEEINKNIITLRAISDIKDELDLETGKLTQRIGEVVLNGSEGWWDNTEYVTDTIIEFGCNIDINIKGNNTIICDKFQPTDVNGVERIYILQNGNVYIRILKTKVTTVNEFKTWLSQNPLTVQYVLKTPIIHQVDLSIVDQDNKSIKSIQTQPTVTHISTSSQGLIPNIVIPSQLKYPTIIKPFTIYTVQLKHTTVNNDNPLTINLGGTTMAVPSTKFTITTPETLTSQDVVFTGKNNVIGEVVITEGDTINRSYSYFEGMKDVKSPSMYVTGKNLFDKNNYTEIGGSQFYSDSIGIDYVSLTIGDANHRWIVLKLPIGKTYSIELNKQNTNPLGWTNAVVESDVNTITKGEIYRTIAYEIHNATKNTKHTFTTTKPYVFIHVGYNPQYNQNKQELLDSIMLNVGSSVASYEPYKGVTIEQSIDSIPLTSDIFTQGYYDWDSMTEGMTIQEVPIISNNQIHSPTRICSNVLFPVKPNTKYCITENLYGWFVFFNKNGECLKKRTGSLASLAGVITNKFTTPKDTYYVGLVLHNENSSTNITTSILDSSNSVLQKDKIVLRSLPNGTKDTLNLSTGEYTQRVGEIVFAGSDDENWFDYKSSETFESHNGFSIQVNNLIYATGIRKILLCDKIAEGDLNSTITKSTNSISIGIHDSPVITIFYDSTIVTDLNNFKNWLSNNPITVQYVLKTPIVTKLDLTILDQDNNIKNNLNLFNEVTHFNTNAENLLPNIVIPKEVSYPALIKPSTKYLVDINHINEKSCTINVGGTDLEFTNEETRKTITTPSTLTNEDISYYGMNAKNNKLLLTEYQEGMENWDLNYFEGMQSVVNPEVITCNSPVRFGKGGRL